MIDNYIFPIFLSKNTLDESNIIPKLYFLRNWEDII